MYVNTSDRSIAQATTIFISALSSRVIFSSMVHCVRHLSVLYVPDGDC